MGATEGLCEGAFVGPTVGVSVVGFFDGASVGSSVVGKLVGSVVDGGRVFGASEGMDV